MAISCPCIYTTNSLISIVRQVIVAIV